MEHVCDGHMSSSLSYLIAWEVMQGVRQPWNEIMKYEELGEHKLMNGD